jgi:hypothetical protein
MPNLQADTRDQVNEILTSIHAKYLELEADHSFVSVSDPGAMQTSIYGFAGEWQRLEDELWTQLDDAVDVEQQRMFRGH